MLIMIDTPHPSIQSMYLIGLKHILGSEFLLDHFFKSGEMGERKWSDLALRLEEVTDTLAAEGISLVAGREAFDDLLHSMGKELGLLDAEFRMLPLRRRVQKGIQILTEWMNAGWELGSSVTGGREVIEIQLQGSPVNFQACFIEGLLQGMLAWISGGKFYPVKIDRSDEGVKLSVARDPID